MPFKDPEKKKQYHKIYHKKYYDSNTKYFRDKNIRRKQMLKNEIDTYKSKIPCMDCGILYPPYVMDFDHRNGKDKLKEVSKLVNNMLSIENIMKEIEKCDLVCANCHRIRTHKRMPSSLAAERPTLDREGEVRIFGGQHE